MSDLTQLVKFDCLRPLAWTSGTQTVFSDRLTDVPVPLRRLIVAHEAAHRRQRLNRRRRLPAWAADPVYRHMIELDAAIGSFAILAGRQPRFSLPDDPAQTACWGEAGHYWTSLCVMLTAGLPFADAKLRAFFSQMPDEVLEFDAIAAAVDWATVEGVSPAAPFAGSPPATPPDERWREEVVVSEGVSFNVEGISIPVMERVTITLPWEAESSASLRRLRARQVSRGLHCLTGRRGTDEVAFRAGNLRQYRARNGADQIRFGFALHCFGDSYAHQVSPEAYASWQRTARTVAGGIGGALAVSGIPMSRPGYMYPEITGHAPTGHGTDELHEHQSQYLAYVGALYDIVTEMFGGADRSRRAGLLTGLRRISDMQFQGDDVAINQAQSAVIRSFCSSMGLATTQQLEAYRPEDENICYWRNFYPSHRTHMSPHAPETVYRIARELGAAWSVD